MAKSINPRGISGAGKNGAPPKVRVSGSGINVKTAVKLPGGTSARNTKNPGAAVGGTKAPKKGPSGRKSTGKLNIKTPGNPGKAGF
jgi:hypothetical protein